MRTMHSGRKRCMAWCSKQFFANKAAFEPNEQIVDQGRVDFGDASQFNPIDFQGPVRVGGPLLPTLPFARLVVQTFTLEGSLFSPNPTGLLYFNEDWFGFSPFNRVSSLFNAATTSGSVFTQAMDLPVFAISSSFWKPKSLSASVLLNISTMA